MKTAKIVFINSNPVLQIDGEEIPACAYITYFEERNDYKAFAEKGFRIYSVNISFADQPINTTSGFTPTFGGVFDKKGKADFSVVDNSVKEILKVCPNAYIFPRIYVCMPQWWIDENPTETVSVPHGKKREILFSYKFRKDAAEILGILIEHLKNGPASDHIFGYQISGGNTQEWFNLDLKGSYCQNSLYYFNEYLKKKRPSVYPVSELPPLDEVKGSNIIKTPLLTDYIRFANEEVAETVEYLCKAAKKAVDYKQIVGTFYGYTSEVRSPLWGTHALSMLLDSQNIDFFSSPNSYFRSREQGYEWGDMMPVDSIKLHGKMCFIECDIRTFLTTSPGKSRAGSDPLNYYNDAVWTGPPNEAQSVWAVRKSLARQLTHTHGLWWFDMFGHWYRSENLMTEMENSLKLYNLPVKEKPLDTPAELAVFLDESSYSKVGKNYPASISPNTVSDILAKCGIPYNVYLIEDFETIVNNCHNFKSIIFAVPLKTEKIKKAVDLCKTKNIRYLCVQDDRSQYDANDIEQFLDISGVWRYTKGKDVFYIGNGFFSLHAVAEGIKTVTFPYQVKITSLDSENTEQICSVFNVKMQKFETKIYRVEKPNKEN